MSRLRAWEFCCVGLLRCVVMAIVAASLLMGCARPPQRIDADDASSKALAYAPNNVRLAAQYKYSELTGRTLRVQSMADIKLRRGEVVLTFDDGPHPRLTPQILDILDQHSVKATFFSVGRMAVSYPQIVREVVRRGHTVGTHTHDHEDIGKMSTQSAIEKVDRGYRSIAAALAPMGATPAPFFRFPYLSDTKVLRTRLSEERLVILDVDIDSKDYRKQTAAEVLERTLARVEQRGRGIVLFHDIQHRTAQALPDFLDALAERGYRVVHLVPDKRGLFDRSLVVAAQSR
jgi:peptidoglycan/xylan/chitin deacetylase (PgdA/CDA1 family)